jgi:hypothetical protein
MCGQTHAVCTGLDNDSWAFRTDILCDNSSYRGFPINSANISIIAGNCPDCGQCFASEYRPVTMDQRYCIAAAEIARQRGEKARIAFHGVTGSCHGSACDAIEKLHRIDGSFNFLQWKKYSTKPIPLNLITDPRHNSEHGRLRNALRGVRAQRRIL